MMVDKNLFLYDLAAVAIMKNEGHYLKEWLDYHLLAGVDHFFIYDNGSTDNQAEIAAPYVKAGLVDYISAPGDVMQMATFNEAVRDFKFLCRYMTFIDSDEFIFPKTNQSIVAVVDEILSANQNAAGVAINWQCFGSNGHETADYSRGVTERFTRRAPSDWIPKTHGNAHIKTVADPRKIDYFRNSHYAIYLEPFNAVNEDGGGVKGPFNEPVTAKKIVVNHYYAKTPEEFSTKIRRGRSDVSFNNYSMNFFYAYNRNEVFDDGILKYCAVRAQELSIEDVTQKFQRVTKALQENLSDFSSAPQEFFVGELETALTCRALSTYLRENYPDDADYWRICEEASLAAVLKSLSNVTSTDAQIFISELPKLFRLPYPVVDELRAVAPEVINQMKAFFRVESFS